MHRLISVLILLVFAGAGMVNAHSFNVLLVGENIADSGAYDGFRLATRERDGHAAEESDGHLGGLDSYIFTAENIAGAMSQSWMDEIDILVMLEGEVLDAPASVYETIRSDALGADDRRVLLDRVAFAQRYTEEFGRAPSEIAQRAYFAARLIEGFVRDNQAFDMR